MWSVRNRSVLVLSSVLACCLVGALASCAGEATETQPTVTPSAGSERASEQASPGQSGQVETIDVRVRDGRPTPELGRVQVPVGSTVRLTVTSDVADEVHVHTYDEELALRPNEPGTVEFTADVPGVFEVELHEAGTVLFSLQVS